MGQSSSRGFKGRNAVSFDKNLSAPDNCGNRKSFDEVRVPPDNMGNKVDYQSLENLVDDNIGNSVEEEPAHLKSGVLSHLLEMSVETLIKKPQRVSRQSLPFSRPRLLATNRSRPDIVKKVADMPRPQTGDEYMASLIKDFAQLLSEKSGLPFSLSMKTLDQRNFDEQTEKLELIQIKHTIEQLLSANSIDAAVTTARYCTRALRFAVFFINPTERDPMKNKILISALRQVVTLHIVKHPVGSINVLLVLANAEKVIEDHLTKLGAQKMIH